MTINRVAFALIAGIVSCILLSCNGGSTEIGNARSGITGKVTENSTAAFSGAVPGFLGYSSGLQNLVISKAHYNIR